MVEFSGSTFCCLEYEEMLTTKVALHHFWMQREKKSPVHWQLSDVIHSSP
jgi:hypothetical protein